MYLRAVRFLPDDLVLSLDSLAPAADGVVIFEVPEKTAERFREAFTERLAKAGFNRAYEPTSEGKLLESLIDRFYGR
jgi:hypothetical protein